MDGDHGPDDRDRTGAIERLLDAIAEVRRRLDRGEAVSLDGIAREVAGAMERLPAVEREIPAEGGRLLLALLDELERLTAAVTRERDEAAARLAELAVRGRAGRAYAARNG